MMEAITWGTAVTTPDSTSVTTTAELANSTV